MEFVSITTDNDVVIVNLSNIQPVPGCVGRYIDYAITPTLIVRQIEYSDLPVRGVNHRNSVRLINALEDGSCECDLCKSNLEWVCRVRHTIREQRGVSELQGSEWPSFSSAAQYQQAAIEAREQARAQDELAFRITEQVNDLDRLRDRLQDVRAQLREENLRFQAAQSRLSEELNVVNRQLAAERLQDVVQDHQPTQAAAGLVNRNVESNGEGSSRGARHGEQPSARAGEQAQNPVNRENEHNNEPPENTQT